MWEFQATAASEMTYIVSRGALNSTNSTLQATAISKHYLRFIITSRKNIFKQLSLTPFSVTNLVIKVRQKARVTKSSFAIYKINQLPTKMWA